MLVWGAQHSTACCNILLDTLNVANEDATSCFRLTFIDNTGSAADNVVFTTEVPIISRGLQSPVPCPHQWGY